MMQTEALVWVANLFEESSGMLTPDTPRQDIPAWDSLGVLTLMAGFDNDFGISLSDDQLQSMKKVNDILEILRSKGALS
jgi:acyl carrier protein